MTGDPIAQPAASFSDGTQARVPDPKLVDAWASEYAAWTENVSQERPVGHETVPTRAEPLNWTPLGKPLSQCTVALITTGGVHLRDQEPFDVFSEEGDWTARTLRGDVDTDKLTATHTHYDRTDCLDDINVMFPLDRLRELADGHVIGAVAPVHYGFMGFLPDPAPLLAESAPAVARDLRDHGVDVVALTGG